MLLRQTAALLPAWNVHGTTAQNTIHKEMSIIIIHSQSFVYLKHGDIEWVILLRSAHVYL